MSQPPLAYDVFLNQRFDLAGRIIDPLSGTIFWNGQSGHMRRQELVFLSVLAAAAQQIVKRQTLIDLVWDGNDLVGEAGINAAVYALRRSLHESDHPQPLIRTIPRKGYQLTVAPQLLSESSEVSLKLGQEIPGKPGSKLLRSISSTPTSQTFLGLDSDGVQYQFRFCLHESYLRALKREITILRFMKAALLERSDCIRIVDWQLAEPPYFLQLSHASHGTLIGYAKTKGGYAEIPLPERLRWVHEIAGALAFVHGLGMVHHQIGSASIFLDQAEGSPVCAKLGQFALAELNDTVSLAELAITAHGFTQGDAATKPAPSIYLAPELAEGHPASAASDVYALGVLIFQAASGDLQNAPTADRSALIHPAGLRALVDQCLHTDASSRPDASVIVQQLLEHRFARSGAPASTPAQAIAAGTRIEVESDIGVPEKPLPEPKAAAASGADHLTGQIIGNYRLLERVGRGGMGMVYLAEQQAPVRRHVAIKVLLAGMDTTEVLSRFEAERQALALMSHNNVAAIFDAGSNALGRPYFAMEYVPGVDIMRHADEHLLNFQMRIELLLQVCDGVLHAHQKGIIHRDLKPSNILIRTAQGQPPTAKIIDFGVAKSLQHGLASSSAHTRLGTFVGTLVYSSPEQVSGHTFAIDTRSDIYSLGVVLYQLLAGVTPYDLEQMTSCSQAALTKLLTDQEPPALLKRFMSLEQAAEHNLATLRQVSVTQMKAVLGSDLSWIVAKCLEHDPNERYASVLDLERDLRRWIANRPVEARPIRWTYRLRKLVLRKRKTVLLGAAVAASVFGTSTAAVVAYLRSERALAEANDVARFQAAQLLRIDPGVSGKDLQEILSDDLQQNQELGPEQRQQIERWLDRVNFADVMVRQLDGFYIHPAIGAIDRDFAHSPLLQARLRHSLSQVLVKLGQFSQASDVLAPALDQRSEWLGTNDPATLELRRTRAQIHQGKGRYDDAESELRDVWVRQQARLGPDHPQTLETMVLLARLLSETRKTVQALAFTEDTLGRQRRVLGNADRATLASMALLSYLLDANGDFERAEQLGREALAGQSTVLGRTHLDTLETLSSLANVVGNRGNVQLAEQYEREVVAGVEQQLGKQHPNTLIAKSNLANTLAKTHRLDEAVQLEREVYAQSLTRFGPTHYATLMPQIHLARWLHRQGQTAEAETLMRAAVAQARITLGETHVITVWSLAELAVILIGKAEAVAEVEALAQQVLTSLAKSNEPDRADTRECLIKLGEYFREQGRPDLVKTLLERASRGA